MFCLLSLVDIGEDSKSKTETQDTKNEKLAWNTVLQIETLNISNS